jgi:YidC/Oxa1 family membrane protein insertase
MSGFLNNSNEPGNQRNVIMASLLAMLVVLLWQAFITPPMPPPASAPAADAPAADEAAPSEATLAPEGSGAPEAAPAIEALPPQHMRLAQHDIALTNEGARLLSVTVREPARYIPHDGIAGIFPEEGEVHLPLALRIGGLPDLTDDAMFALDEAASTQGEDGGFQTVVYRWTSPDGGIEVVKTYRADERPFGVALDVEVINRGTAARRFENLDVRVYGSFSQDGGGIFDQGGSIAEVLCLGEFGTKRKPARKIEETREYLGATRFVAVDERYFMTAVAPRNELATSCRFEAVDASHVRSVLSFDGFSVEPGDSGARTWSFTVYSGPKDEQFLETYDVDGHDFDRSIDFGLFSFLALPIRMLLLFLQGLVVNWGLAIILLTFVIKLILLPITQKGYESMEKMKRVQPKLKALQAKYENDKMKLAEEQMAMFKAEGVSPMGGCLPMLMQMPIYFALYRTIWGSTELYNAPFVLWIQDLSQRDPYYVLPVLMGGVMFIQQRLMPQAADNPQLQMVNKIMPIMFTGFMLFLPSGLVLYIFVNMLLSILQMLYIRQKFGTSTDTEKS